MKIGETRTSPYRIIVVDDEVSEREMLVQLLSAPHRSVEAFASAETALEFVRQNPVDIAFLDHVMPGMSGTELAAQIKALYPQSHIVMCTGYLIEVSHPKVLANADQVFHKPLRLGEILEYANTYTAR